MDFLSFLATSGSPAWWQSWSCVYCTGSEYPVLFFSTFIERCKKSALGHIQVMDLADSSIDSAIAQFSTSFLGNRTYYWLKNISELDAKKRSYWLGYLQSYQGPNCLIFFSDKHMAHVKSDSVKHIEIPDQFDITTSAPIFNALVPNDTRSCSLVVRAVFKSRRKISLDSICLLTYYIEASGAELEKFLNSWLDTIIVPESSLFDLSKYLFARKPESFFRVWQTMGSMYGELFWIAYWGDIFWRAYHFLRLSTMGQHEQAKKFATRLPFTFIQGGWRHITLEELKGALNYVYALDADVKNGVQGYPFLELFYLKFFLRHFDVRRMHDL